MCANKVVAGARIRSLLPSVHLASTRQITSACDFPKLEVLAGAIPWRFESSLPHQPSLTLEIRSVSFGWQAMRRLSTIAVEAATVDFAVRSWRATTGLCPNQAADSERSLLEKIIDARSVSQSASGEAISNVGEPAHRH